MRMGTNMMIMAERVAVMVVVVAVPMMVTVMMLMMKMVVTDHRLPALPPSATRQ
jgi:hypothetical protein